MRISVQTPLDAQPGFGTQRCYGATDDLQVKSVTKCTDRASEAAPLTVTQICCGAAKLKNPRKPGNHLCCTFDFEKRNFGLNFRTKRFFLKIIWQTI